MGHRLDALTRRHGLTVFKLLNALGKFFDTVLPPPEERKHVKTAIGAARAEQQRTRAK